MSIRFCFTNNTTDFCLSRGKGEHSRAVESWTISYIQPFAESRTYKASNRFQEGAHEIAEWRARRSRVLNDRLRAAYQKTDRFIVSK